MYIAQLGPFGARPFEEQDAANVANWMSVSPMKLFLLSSSLTFPVRTEDFIRHAQHTKPAEHKLYSVFFVESGLHIGHFEIKNVNIRHNIGTGSHIVLAPEYRGKGMGRDFVELLSEIGFSILGLERIGLNVHTVNHAAIAAYKKAGYSVEGLIREVLLFEGKRYSLYQMSLLRREWEADHKNRKEDTK